MTGRRTVRRPWHAATRSATRIIVVRTVNQGTARARETGIRHAQGDYICFLDGDDVWDSRMLEKLVAAIGENGGYDIVCCDYKRICKTYEAPRREMRTSDMQGLDFLVASLYHAISVTVWGGSIAGRCSKKELRHYPLRLGKTACSTSRSAASSRASGLSTTWATGMQRGGSANRSPLDIGYCVKFSEAVRAELVRHRDILGDRLEFYLLLNKNALVPGLPAQEPQPVGRRYGVCPRDQCGGRTLPRGVGRVLQPLRPVAAENGQAAVDAPRGARRLDPDALGKEPEAAAGALNR